MSSSSPSKRLRRDDGTSSSAQAIPHAETVQGEGSGSSNPLSEECLSLDDFYMAVAFLSSKRSKDPATQVGACIVTADNSIRGIGYNGMPNGCNDDEMPWGKDEDDKMKNKHTYVCHAELNAIIHTYRADMTGARMFVTLTPCNECAKLIIQAKIKEVYYLTEKTSEPFKQARKLFEKAQIKCSKYKPEKQTITLLSGDSNESDSSSEVTMDRDSNNVKRRDYISWELYFMAMAKLCSLRSKDPSTKVGACIRTPNKRIIGIGYNEMPQGCEGLWKEKHPFVGHAAVNAVINMITSDVSASTLYTTLFPCSECVKVLIQAGIKEIVYYSDAYNYEGYKERMPGAKFMLNKAGIKYRPFDEETVRKVKVEINYH